MYKVFIALATLSAMPSHTGDHLNMDLRGTNNSGDYCDNRPSRDVVREARYIDPGEKRDVLEEVIKSQEGKPTLKFRFTCRTTKTVPPRTTLHFVVHLKKENRVSICM